MRALRSLIDGPKPAPRPFGLFSVADVKMAGTRDNSGFEYEVLCGRNVEYYVDPCSTFVTKVDAAAASPFPATVKIADIVPGDYTIDWGDGTADSTLTIADGDFLVTSTHNYTTNTETTVTVVGPLGFGTRTATITPGTASEAPADALVKQEQDGVTTVFGEPVHIYGLSKCKPVGLDKATRTARAMAALTANEEYAIEAALLVRAFGSAVDLTGGTATNAKRALALLENYAARHYAGVPVLHLDPFTASELAADGLIEKAGNQMKTKLGTLVVVGAGYSQHPLPTNVTAWISGMVVVKQGVASVQDAVETGAPDNSVTDLAERTDTVSVECFVASAEIATA